MRNGQASPFAGYFDIDWSGATGWRPGKLLLPILGAPLEQAIAERQVKLRWDEAGRVFRLDYYERSLPVNARGAALIFAPRPARPATTADRRRRSRRPSSRMPGGSGLVAAVAHCQHYELAPWQEAATRINYRRFFDVSGLAALRIEDPAVFEVTHRQVVELVRAGIVERPARRPSRRPARSRRPTSSGCRKRWPRAATSIAAKGPLYIVAEKILRRRRGPAGGLAGDGTTGYDFANLACGLLLDGETAGESTGPGATSPANSRKLRRPRPSPPRRKCSSAASAARWQSLSRRFLDLLPPALQQPREPAAIATVLAETIACFPGLPHLSRARGTRRGSAA